MTAGVIRDLLVLAAIAAVPAGLALFLLRHGLASRGGRFWKAASVGLFTLGGFALFAVWAAVIMAENEVAACRSAPAGQQVECADASLLVGLIGIPAAASLVIFMFGALVFVLVRLARRTGQGAPPPQTP